MIIPDERNRRDRRSLVVVDQKPQSVLVIDTNLHKTWFDIISLLEVQASPVP
jgi:hypothetical protein